jgi:membrane-bound lytic murein transglycosylase A
VRGPTELLSPLLLPLSYFDIHGWRGDDLAAALSCFRAAFRASGVTAKTRALGVDGAALRQAAARAADADELSGEAARKFWERHFVPHRIAARGFVTGYYEPEVEASRSPTGKFRVPLYRRPPDLIEVNDNNRPRGWNSDIRFGRETASGIEPYFDRAAIENGALAGRDLELAYVEDPIDAFFIHVQGSARLRFTDGGTMRIAFDGKSGHSYTSIGRLAVERGILSREAADKDGLEAWLKANPEEGRALMRQNHSFIFFKETAVADTEGPLGAGGVPLTAGRSLAVDRTLHTFQTPIWVEVAELADPDRRDRPFGRLMLAQDTGSAIVGPARGDIFFGSGAVAGALAGRVRHAASMIAFVPAGTTLIKHDT